jgi:archaetidylinositol phosphate synthase
MKKTHSNSASPGPVPPPRTLLHAIARWCIRPLIRTSVTPNHITTLRLLTGIAAAVAFGVGNYYWSAWGGLIFFISAVLDRADGELARLANRSTPGGHWYDLWCDMIVNVLIFVGIGVGLRERIGLWAPLMGVIAGFSVAATFLVSFGLYARGDHPILAYKFPVGFDFDDALVVIAPCAWFKLLLPLLVVAVIGAPLFLLFALWRSRKVFVRESAPASVPCTEPPQQERIPGSSTALRSAASQLEPRVPS